MPTTSITTALADLPPQIAERVRVVETRPINADGEFVLYWMSHAMRVDENPALDAAVVISKALDQPLLVYQGLSGAHGFNNDRSLSFILDGACDMSNALAECGIRYAFHMPDRTNYPGPLPELAKLASVVVAEEVPTKPYVGWRRQLSRRVPRTPVVLVDTGSMLPMRLVSHAYLDVNQFREQTAAELDRRAVQTWPVIDDSPAPMPASLTLPFDPVDLTKVSPGDLIAVCADADHGVGPIAAWRGGTVAAEQAWSEFRKHALPSYRRGAAGEDAAILNAYLHYGMIAPMRVVRDTFNNPGPGAQELLDLLLVDRELAYSFCFHRTDHDSLDALPEWAKETLAAHERDPRPALHDLETLARAETEDERWNRVQRRLSTRGGLAGDERRYWAKRLLEWTPSADEALCLANELYQRYALDGGDATTFVTHLTAFGLFDRPVRPERPITGALRPAERRASSSLPAATESISRQRGAASMSVGVVGAGLAGLIAARILKDHELDVRVFERGRSAGGRCSTRQAAGWAFDVGAQYFTVRDGRVARLVNAWNRQALVEEWSGTIVDLVDQSWRATSRIARRFVGTPSMRAIPERLASTVEVDYGAEVAAITRQGELWSITGDDARELGAFDAVIVATPAGEAAPLLHEAPSLASQASLVNMKPCWAVMLAFDEPTQIDFDGAFVYGSPLSWIARDSSKPGRVTPAPNGETWILHGSNDWSSGHLELSREEVVKRLFRAFVEALNEPLPKPVFASPYRWRYSIPVEETPNDRHDPCLWDARLQIGACGDWCARGRVEGALLSGMAIAGRVMRLALDLRPASTADSLLSAFE